MAVTDDIRASSDTLLHAKPPRRPANMGQTIRFLLLFLGGILMIMPIIYMFSTSLKWPHEVYNLKLIPDEPTIENYTYVLEDGRFFGWFFNSIIIATVTTISNVLFDSLVESEEEEQCMRQRLQRILRRTIGGAGRGRRMPMPAKTMPARRSRKPWKRTRRVHLT